MLLLLLVLGLSVTSLLFHECGHAAACRYGGARPGVIGMGIYVIWPAFFTNVTDSYRLGRAGRVRTDLGGVYFNAIFVVLLIAAYFGTGYAPLAGRRHPDPPGDRPAAAAAVRPVRISSVFLGDGHFALSITAIAVPAGRPGAAAVSIGFPLAASRTLHRDARLSRRHPR